MNQFYVLADSGAYRRGQVVDMHNARRAHSQGVPMIPLDVDLCSRSGVAGVSERAWGPWPLANVPTPACPMTLFLHPVQSRIHWRARIRARSMHDLQGVIRLASDSGQAGLTVGLSGDPQGVLIDRLREPDEEGCWVVGGTMRAHPHVEGHYGFMLYGFGPGVAVLWSAISQVRETESDNAGVLVGVQAPSPA